ncbi:MAG: hypothetical protein KJN90_12350 [Gammaproteobacteria bacterium]|nr:hypothetical protein [Gammaproteobacteria bacterium]
MIPRKFLIALIYSASVFIGLPGTVEAAEFRRGVEVVIGADEVVNEDIYVVAGRIIVDGTINGDLLAAGENVEVNGAVNGDLIVAARVISVRGAVEDDVRAAGAELRFQSSIGEDLIAAGYQIEIETESFIGQDLVASANTLILNGDIRGDLDLNVMEATIAGTIDGTVQGVIEEQLILSPESRIEGALNYTSANEVNLQSGAQVAGDVTQQLPVVELFGIEYTVSTITLIVSKVIEQTKWFIGTLLVGLILIWLCPGTIHNVVETLSKSPLKSLGIGILVIPLMPIMLLVTMIAVLSVVGFSAFPIVAIPGTAFAALLLLAKPVLAIAIGGHIAERTSKTREPTNTGSLALGAAILAVLGLIPFVDSLVGWLTLFLGFGMWLLFLTRRYREAKAGS